MLESALQLLKEINGHGFVSYIVGGFVRDRILGIESNDIDITTNATPKEIKDIFEDSFLPSEDYGSVTVVKYGIRFEITTFREDINYVNNRRPTEVRYIDELDKDLFRRDFTINAICMDEAGNLIDLLNGIDDINSRIIKTIGNPKVRFNEDCLRILRAIRFAATLDFELDDSVCQAIINKKHLLRGLSYYRKKEELSKIFSSSNKKRGVELLLKFGLDEELELSRLNDILDIDDLIGVWCVLDVVDKYPFTNSEKALIKDINSVLECNNLDPMILYKYGLYVNSVACDIKGIDRKKIAFAYDNLVISSRKEIDITTEEITLCLNREPGEYLKDIYSVIEHDILYKKLKNKKEDILDFIKKNYSN